MRHRQKPAEKEALIRAGGVHNISMDEEEKVPPLGATVLYREQEWIVVRRDEAKQTANIKIPGSSGTSNTSLTVAWKNLRYPEPSAG